MMKLLILVLVSFCAGPVASRRFHLGRLYGGNLGAPARVNKTYEVNINWFKQILDHFNPTDKRIFYQRYFINNESYTEKNGGPVFLMIGGEGEAKGQWMVEGTWIDYAKKFGALCFLLEHRYYGQSQPKNDLSTENLQYLSSQQALGDIATFITAMNKKHQLPKNVKWIVFGGFYSGTLAIWMRQKYPHLVAGAVSASAPMLAKLDFSDYYKIVTEVLETHSKECAKEIRESIKIVEENLNTTEGRKKNVDTLAICVEDNFELGVFEPDTSSLFSALASNIARVVQFDKDRRNGNVRFTLNMTIDNLCYTMTNTTFGSPLQRLALFNNKIIGEQRAACFSFLYTEMIDELKSTDFINEGARQWTYQTCTEFGFYQSSAQQSLFGYKFPINYFIQMCTEIFGSKFNLDFMKKSIDRTNTNYGGLDIKISNVVIVHGSTDPWHALGITVSPNHNSYVYFINGTGHCAFLYPKSDKDVPELTSTREDVSKIIGLWLQPKV